MKYEIGTKVQVTTTLCMDDEPYKDQIGKVIENHEQEENGGQMEQLYKVELKLKGMGYPRQLYFFESQLEEVTKTKPKNNEIPTINSNPVTLHVGSAEFKETNCGRDIRDIHPKGHENNNDQRLHTEENPG